MFKLKKKLLGGAKKAGSLIHDQVSPKGIASNFSDMHDNFSSNGVPSIPVKNRLIKPMDGMDGLFGQVKDSMGSNMMNPYQNTINSLASAAQNQGSPGMRPKKNQGSPGMRPKRPASGIPVAKPQAPVAPTVFPTEQFGMNLAKPEPVQQPIGIRPIQRPYMGTEDRMPMSQAPVSNIQDPSFEMEMRRRLGRE